MKSKATTIKGVREGKQQGRIWRKSRMTRENSKGQAIMPRTSTTTIGMDGTCERRKRSQTKENADKRKKPWTTKGKQGRVKEKTKASI